MAGDRCKDKSFGRFVEEAIGIVSMHASVALLMFSSFLFLAVPNVGLAKLVFMSILVIFMSAVLTLCVILYYLRYGVSLLRESLGESYIIWGVAGVYLLGYGYLSYVAISPILIAYIDVLFGVIRSGGGLEIKVLSQTSPFITLLFIIPAIVPLFLKIILRLFACSCSKSK